MLKNTFNRCSIARLLQKSYKYLYFFPFNAGNTTNLLNLAVHFTQFILTTGRLQTFEVVGIGPKAFTSVHDYSSNLLWIFFTVNRIAPTWLQTLLAPAIQVQCRVMILPYLLAIIHTFSAFSFIPCECFTCNKTIICINNTHQHKFISCKSTNSETVVKHDVHTP